MKRPIVLFMLLVLSVWVVSTAAQDVTPVPPTETETASPTFELPTATLTPEPPTETPLSLTATLTPEPPTPTLFPTDTPTALPSAILTPTDTTTTEPTFTPTLPATGTEPPTDLPTATSTMTPTAAFSPDEPPPAAAAFSRFADRDDYALVAAGDLTALYAAVDAVNAGLISVIYLNADGQRTDPAAARTYWLTTRLRFDRDVVIYGNGAILRQTPVVSAPFFPRVLYVPPGVTVELRSVELSGADLTIFNVPFARYGAGVTNDGSLRLLDSLVQENTAREGGGGIFNAGLLWLERTTIALNRAGGGAGIQNDSGGSIVAICSRFISNLGGYGVGILNGNVSNDTSSITVNRSVFTGNIRELDGTQEDIFNLMGETLTLDARNNYWGADGIPNLDTGPGGASILTEPRLTEDPTVPNASGSYPYPECAPAPPQPIPTFCVVAGPQCSAQFQPPQLSLNLDVDFARLTPDQLADPYTFTVGEQIPLLAQVSALDGRDVPETVRIELTVPRGLRPQGMTIQGEDQSFLNLLFNLLITLLDLISPDLSGLVNDILGIDVTPDTVTFIYDYAGGLIVGGQPFPITLDVVGQVPGTFEVSGTGYVRTSSPRNAEDFTALITPIQAQPTPTTTVLTLQIIAPDPATCPVYEAYQANQPINIQLLNQVFTSTDSALKHACLYMYRDLIYYIIFHEMSALHINPYVSDEDAYSLSVLENRTYAPTWGVQEAIAASELAPFDGMPRFDSFYYLFARVTTNGMMSRIVEQRAEPLVGYFGSNFNSAMSTGDCAGRAKVELESVGGRTFQPVCAYLPFWDVYAASIRAQGISDGTWIGEFATYGLPEVDRAIYHAAYGVSDPTDNADGVRPVNRGWFGGEPRLSSPFVFRTYIDLMTTYTWGFRDYVVDGNTFTEEYVVSPSLSLSGSTQVAAALGETCSNVNETLAQSYMRNLRLIYRDATYQSIPAYPDASRAYLTRNDVRYGMSTEYSRSANALVVESQSTRDGSGQPIPLPFSLAFEAPVGDVGSLSWQTYRFTRPLTANDANFPTDRPILQFLNALEPVPSVSDASGQPQRVEFILCP